MTVVIIGGAAVAVGGGIFKAIGGARRARKAKKAAKKARKKLNKMKKAFSKIDTSNPFAKAKNAFKGLQNSFKNQKNMYKNMENKYANQKNSFDNMKNSYDSVENSMEDLTVDTKQAEFEAKQNEATQANILSSMAGAAGGSGIAALAQSMANQGALNASKASASIGQQESANQKLAAQEQSRIDMAKAAEQGNIDKAKAAEQGRLDSQEAQGAADVQKTIMGEESEMQSRKLAEDSRLQTQEAQGDMDVQKLKGEGQIQSAKMTMEKQGKLMDMQSADVAKHEGAQKEGRKSMWAGIGGVAKGLLGFSDERLKENIKTIGWSLSRIPIYTFNYKGSNKIWTGTMAQDLIKMGRCDAVEKMPNGYYGVYYDMIDVDLRLVKENKNN